MNQLLPAGNSCCCAIARALVAGKSRPQNAVATKSIWRALIRCASANMRATYRQPYTEGKENEGARLALGVIDLGARIAPLNPAIKNAKCPTKSGNSNGD